MTSGMGVAAAVGAVGLAVAIFVGRWLLALGFAAGQRKLKLSGLQREVTEKLNKLHGDCPLKKVEVKFDKVKNAWEVTLE